MLRLSQIVLGFLLLVSCSQTKQENVAHFEIGDQEMNDAIVKSRDSFNEFEEAFVSNKEGLNSFAIKVAFGDAIGGSEHIWIVDITKDGKDYYGNVGNEPESTTEVVYGQHIKIEKQGISDWMYLENNILRGGNTLRVIRKRMSPAEQAQFDDQTGFIIED